MRQECRECFPRYQLQMKPLVSHPGTHHDTCAHARAVMHVGIANPRCRGKRSRHSRRRGNPQFYVSDKRPMDNKQYVLCYDDFVLHINVYNPLQWLHNERDGVSNQRRLDCLLIRLFRRTSNKTSKLRVTGLCEGSRRWPGGFPSPRTDSVSLIMGYNSYKET